MSEFPQTPEFTNRYDRIDTLNRASWYLNDSERSFSVTMSLNSAGDPRRPIPYQVDRVVQAGNMSPVRLADGKVPYGPRHLTDQERYDDAVANMNAYFDSLGVDPSTVRVLNPERTYFESPLSVVNVDEDDSAYKGGEPVKLKERGDFIYTYNPDVVMAVRPADCPIAVMSAETPKGRIYMMLHFAWRGPAYGQFEDMYKELALLDVDLSTLDVYVTPGGHAETLSFVDYTPDDTLEKPVPYEGNLFVGVVEDKGAQTYTFGIDMPKAVYDAFIDLGLEERQIFLDTTDTASMESGYGSHTRAAKGREDNVRDLVVVRSEHFDNPVASNPERPTPPEIAWQITPLEVEYLDFNGEVRQGTIEVNRAVYEDVKLFFAKAFELGFPIENVVRSSDPDYAWDDDKLIAANTSSGFNYRLIKGTDRPSLHGRGLALDVNTRLNPYIRHFEDGSVSASPDGAVYDPSQPGVLTPDHELVIFMKDRGWEWGGDWLPESGRTDYQHFQKNLEL